MPQTIQQRAALSANIHRRLRGLPAPTRNGAFAVVTPPTAKPAGACVPRPQAPATPHIAQVVGFVVVVLTWAVMLYAATVGLGLNQ